MRTIFVIAALLQGIVLSGQTAVEFGVLTPFEREFETYEKDSTAHAVYLNERGDSYFEVQDRHIWLIKKYHAKKKILDQRGFSQAEVVIPYYHSDNRSERVTNLRAMTHNGTLRHSVMPEQVFEVDEAEFWSMKNSPSPKWKWAPSWNIPMRSDLPISSILGAGAFRMEFPRSFRNSTPRSPATINTTGP